MRFYFTFICLHLLGAASFAQVLTLEKGQASHDVSLKIQTLYDTAGKLEIADILSAKQQARFRQENGINRHIKHHWYKIEIDNQTAKTLFYLEVHNAFHTELYLLQPNQTTHYRNGAMLAWQDRAYLGSYTHFPVQLQAGKNTLYVVFKALSPCDRCLQKKFFRLHDRQVVYLKHIHAHVINFSILGILLGLMLYNLFIYFLIRDVSYAHYVLSLVGLIGSIFFADVLSFFWYKFHDIFFLEYAHILANFFVGVGGIFFLRFSQSYLNTRLSYPVWHKALRLFAYSLGIFTILMIVGGLSRNWNSDFEVYVVLLGNVVFGIIALSLIFLSLQAWRSGSPTGKYYAFSNVAFFFCVMVYVSGLLFEGLYPFTAQFMKIGIAVQTLSFSVALANRINLLKQEIAYEKLENERLEKEKIQEIQQLTARQNLELEAKVKERTRELEQSNEEIRTQADKIEKQARLIEDQKNRELLNHTLQILQKNELLPAIGKFLEHHSTQLNEQARKESKQLQKEIQNNIASDTNWDLLKMHFEEVHPTLFVALQKLNPDLTKNDLRYCAYLKMGLSNKDIAQLLHLDTDSVRKQQYRIKQKLGLGKDTSLNDFVKNLTTN